MRTRRPRARSAAIPTTWAVSTLPASWRSPASGKSIAAKITEYLDTGTFAELEELRAQVPAGVREMTAIPGFGPKKAMVVYQELAIDSVAELVAAAEAGELRSLKGFSAKTEQNMLAGRQAHAARPAAGCW